MGVGSALHEESLPDLPPGRFMNHNFAEHQVPANADVKDLKVVFIEEQDHIASPMGVKGLGEFGIVGMAAVIANALFHATGRCVRDLPVTIETVLGIEQAGPGAENGAGSFDHCGRRRHHG